VDAVMLKTNGSTLNLDQIKWHQSSTSSASAEQIPGVVVLISDEFYPREHRR